jgi:hypothetical protein
MADVKDRNRNLDEKYKDQGDGTYATAVAAYGYAWDASITDWVRLTADHNTGGVNIVFAVPTLKTAVINLTSTGTVITAVAAKRLKVYSVLLGVSANQTVNWRDGGSTALDGPMAIAANGGYALACSYPTFLFATTAGNSLDLVISGAGTVAGRVSYWDTDSA